MEKRGQAEVLQITLLFEFIAGILIAGILIYAVIQLNDTSSITEEYLRQDYKIIKNIMEGEPGDYRVTYPTGAFTVENNDFKQPDGMKIKTDQKAIITKQDNKVEIKKA
ncbi:MAG: hypothetical protein QW404_00100 [Candidatus Nanoarchaeia archaeon]